MAGVVTIYVPCDAAALSMGAADVAKALSAEAAKRGTNVRIVRNGSRGMFWLEPLVEVATAQGRIAYGPVGVEDVAPLFDAWLAGRAHHLLLGPTEEIPYLKNQERLTFARVGVVDPLDLADYEAHGGLSGLTKARSMTPEQIVAEITESGLRGRGGAGFPAGIKWKTVFDTNASQKYICCNADEGDSGTFADRMLMEGDPSSLIEGMAIAALATGASEGYIYIRSEYPHATRTMKAAIAEWDKAGLIGDSLVGTGKPFRLFVRRGAGAYICGEESSMLESLEGKRGVVRAKPPVPAVSGLNGKPTIVNNVLTLASVPAIIAKGAAGYKGLGTGRSRGTQAFQLAGNVKHGGLVEKAFGVTLRDLVTTFGGGTATGRPIRAIQIGGPLGAYVPNAQIDLPMDYEALAAAGAMLGHGGIVVFDETVDMARQARFAFEFCAIESCGKCTPCRIGAVRGRETIDKIIAGADVERNIALVHDLCETMTDGSLCAMGGLTPMPVESALKHWPEDFQREKRQAAE
jgi:formate dehydrogenase iron-sulfur subunit